MSGLTKGNLSARILLASAVIVFSACSVEKNTLTSRFFHNVTSKYNILFNGEQSYQEGRNRIAGNFKDDYTGILPVFIYGTKEEMSVADADMDRAIEKASKLMTMHSITAKPEARAGRTLTERQREFYSRKEYNSYVDDAYLLMGKAYFHKRDYTLAEKVFLQVQNDFKGNPEAYESQVWLARIYNESGQFRYAGEIFSQLENNAAYPEKQLGFLYAALADYQLKQKNYPAALQYLLKALENERSKSTRSRYLFIIAQLYEKTGDFISASANYGKVISMNPPFEMAFHARINQAMTYREGYGNDSEIESELKKMLRDDKYNDYQDQVYYALGDFYLVTGDSTAAMENYMLSAGANSGNADQKLRSFLTIADFYYNIPDYIRSQAFYDSALSLVNTDYEDYDALVRKEASLTRLVGYLNTITLEDSVQMLAKLDRNTLNTRIDAIIEAERQGREDEQQRLAEEQLERQYATRVAQESRTSNESSQWYFYNETAKSLGYNEFKVVWGNRGLEDHWQRADRTSFAFSQGYNTGNEQYDDVAAEAPEAAGSPLSRSFYMASVPLTDSAMEASHSRIETALYESGMIYRNELKDYGRASEAFRELIRRYPSSENILPAYYDLYSISKEQGNLAMEEYYKGIIVSRYPETTYAMVLNNPDYPQELERNRQMEEDYYEVTYGLYSEGDYAGVIERSRYALQNFSGEELLQRFAYLEVLARGRGSDREVFRQELLRFASEYPGTAVAEDATMIAGYIAREVPEIAEKVEKETISALYENNPSISHNFVYVVDRSGNYNQLIFNIINYNLDNFDELDLDVEMVNLTPQQNLVVVREFSDMNEAYEYMERIKGVPGIISEIPGVSSESFIISVRNFESLLKDKSISRYMQFNNENYR